MSNANKKMLDDLMSEVKNIRKLLDELSIRQASVEEIGHMSMRLLNDLSAKKDLELCSLNLKIPAAKKSGASSSKSSALNSKKMNIMAYFKHKYKEDPTFLYDIITEEEMESALSKYSAEINKKKNKGDIESAKANILYKEFMTNNKVNQNRLRSKKEQEEEKYMVQQEELEECDIVDAATDDNASVTTREDNLEEYETEASEEDYEYRDD